MGPRLGYREYKDEWNKVQALRELGCGGTERQGHRPVILRTEKCCASHRVCGPPTGRARKGKRLRENVSGRLVLMSRLSGLRG